MYDERLSYNRGCLARRDGRGRYMCWTCATLRDSGRRDSNPRHSAWEANFAGNVKIWRALDIWRFCRDFLDLRRLHSVRRGLLLYGHKGVCHTVCHTIRAVFGLGSVPIGRCVGLAGVVKLPPAFGLAAGAWKVGGKLPLAWLARGSSFSWAFRPGGRGLGKCKESAWKVASGLGITRCRCSRLRLRRVPRSSNCPRFRNLRRGDLDPGLAGHTRPGSHSPRLRPIGA